MKRRGWFKSSQLWFLLIVLNVVLLVMGSIFLSRYRNGAQTNIAQSIDSLSLKQSTPRSPQYYATPTFTPESFSFDPNEADSTQLLRLGLAPFQVRSIYRYRAKGGRFSTKDDFRRVYRLTNEQWEHLSPLICIAKKYQLVDIPQSPSRFPAKSRGGEVPIPYPDSLQALSHSSLRHDSVKVQYPVKLTGDEVLDVNAADSAQLCRVPGIGPYFARQIIRYRRRLGGYSNVQQLLQIDNFPANSIAWFVISDTVALQKLNVNTLSIRKLMKHPYMGFYRASDIESYRRIYGRIRDIDELRKLAHFTEDDIDRLEPYLEFGEVKSEK